MGNTVIQRDIESGVNGVKTQNGVAYKTYEQSLRKRSMSVTSVIFTYRQTYRGRTQI